MKNNKKGFMLAEIIILSVIVSIVLVSLFTLVNKMFLQYDKRIVYDNVDATYVSRGLAENYIDGLIKNDFQTNDNLQYMEFDTAMNSSELFSMFSTYTEKNNIVESYIVRYKKESIEELLSNEINNIEQNFYDYIELYKENNDFNDSLFINTDENADTYNYVIFTEISDNCNGNMECTEDNGNISFGYYKFKYVIKEKNDVEEDNEPPRVYGLKYMGKNGKESDLNGYVVWSATDFHGSQINKFVVTVNSKNVNVIYDNTNNIYKVENEASNTNIYDETNNIFKLDINYLNLNGGLKSVKIYAEDEKKNSGKDSCLSTSSLHCINDSIVVGKLKYKVELKYLDAEKNNQPVGDNTNCPKFTWVTNPDTGIYSGATVKFKAYNSCSYGLTNWEVKSSTLTFTDSSGKETIKKDYDSQNEISFNVGNGNLDINISYEVVRKDKCLAEGTKVLLANGKYKNIEDIDYNDLLTVFDHEKGIISYQYPSWIEAPGINNNYILITFDDNTELKVVNDHGIYSLDYNEYVRIYDKEKFKIGSRVAKIKNGKLEEVKVKDIQVIEDEVRYYFMFTNRHFNLITNDILTGSPDVFIYNFHGFNNDLTWKTPLLENDIYSYDELSEVPYYLYKGMRLYEGKYFNNYGMNKEGYLNFLRSTIINDNRTVKPKLNENGKREWMVTTSEDIDTEDNKLSYLMEEGDYYTLKAPKNINGKKFIGWLHTGENIMYQPGDKVEVLYGTHFVAKYQELFDGFNGSDKFEKIK